jgi:hypothetical protein
MNERIRELAIEAGYEKDMFGIGHWNMPECKKFAELIVRECISVMKSTVDESIDYERNLDETSSWIESDIKKHFGVEL